MAICGCLIGCVDYNNRPPPSQAEVKASDVKRQNYMDTLPMTPEQKAAAKAHMGGPPTPPPAGMPNQQAGSPAGSSGK